MSGKLTKLDRIIKSIRIVKKIDNEYRYDVESMLYAFAAKIAIKEGMSDELIARLTGLTESQVNIIRKSINN